MEKMKYDLDYFIAKFEKIPDDEWTDQGEFVDRSGCKCAYGHCGAIKSKNDSEESTALYKIDEYYNIVPVNDNWRGNFAHLGTTPKQRVVNYLKSLRNDVL